MVDKKKPTPRRKNLRTQVFTNDNDLELSPINPSWGDKQKISVLWANQNKLLNQIKKIVENG